MKTHRTWAIWGKTNLQGIILHNQGLVIETFCTFWSTSWSIWREVNAGKSVQWVEGEETTIEHNRIALSECPTTKLEWFERRQICWLSQFSVTYWSGSKTKQSRMHHYPLQETPAWASLFCQSDETGNTLEHNAITIKKGVFIKRERFEGRQIYRE